jgi:hypothetical protein
VLGHGFVVDARLARSLGKVAGALSDKVDGFELFVGKFSLLT